MAEKNDPSQRWLDRRANEFCVLHAGAALGTLFLVGSGWQTRTDAGTMLASISLGTGILYVGCALWNSRGRLAAQKSPTQTDDLIR